MGQPAGRSLLRTDCKQGRADGRGGVQAWWLRLALAGAQYVQVVMLTALE